MNESKTKAETKTLTGTDLRNRSWRLINSAQLDYKPKYIGVDRKDPDSSEDVPCIDGLIRTPFGYYRLAEDTRDGARILLHSYEKEQLIGEKRGGVVVIPSLDQKDYDIYGVTARQNVRGAIFREDMQHDSRYLSQCFQKDLNLHSEDISPKVKNENEKPLKAVKLANGRAAFGIFETKDNKWSVRAYDNLRKEWDKTGRFTFVDQNGSGSLFSVSEDLKDFDQYEDALKYVRRFWNIASLKLFRGQSLPFETNNQKGIKGFKARAMKTVFGFWDQKKYRDWGVAVPIGISAGFFSTLVSGTPIFGALLGLGTTAAWALGAKAVENVVSSRLKKGREEKDNEEYQKLAPYFEKNNVNEYLDTGVENKLRFRKKLNPEALPHLRLLNHDEADMNYDDGDYTPLYNPMKDFERVATAPYRYFGAIFDTTHHEKGVLTAIFPNGLVKLTHVDLDTRDTRHYLTYRSDFNEIKGNRKHLDPKLTKLPGDGPIHKVTHCKGKDFRYASLTEDEFIADAMDKIGYEFKDYKAFGMKITDLFNAKSSQKIEPKAVEGMAVDQVTAKVKPELSTALN
jgi:hypothetical protein